MSLPKPAGGYLKVAHRGASALAPENSLAALDAALAAEVDMIELDVLAVDGGLRLAHSAAQVQPDSPVLEEALRLFARQAPPRIWLDLDVKTPGDEEGIVWAVAPYGLLERTLVTSFHPQVFGRPSGSNRNHRASRTRTTATASASDARFASSSRRGFACSARRFLPASAACSPAPVRMPPCSITCS